MAIPRADPLVAIRPLLIRQPVPQAQDPAGHHTQGTWVDHRSKEVAGRLHLHRQHQVICTAGQPGLRVHKDTAHDRPIPEVRVAPQQQQLVLLLPGSPMVDSLHTRINIRYVII